MHSIGKNYGDWEVQNKSRFWKQNKLQRKCKSKKTIIQKTQQQSQKHYKSENTMTNPKTKQIRKHNDKSDKPEEVGIVWDGAIGLGIDYSPLTGRDICQSRYRTRRRIAESWNISSSGTDGKSCVIAFWCDRPVVRSHLLPNFFFSPFSNIVSHRKGIYFQ